MSDDVTKRDEWWGLLLSRCHGKVEADGNFRVALLESLKGRMREKAEESRDVGSDENWSRLLSRAYPPCEPSENFRSFLFLDLKDRQRQLIDTRNETVIHELLSTSYNPVQPRQEFETRLLENLKQRQKTRVIYKQAIRRRSIFASFASGLAAAAAVLFILWVGPIDMHGASAPASAGVASASSDHAVAPFDQAVSVSDVASAPDSGDFAVVQAVAAVPTVAAFASRALPKTAVGIGMELNDGSGWRSMDETSLTRVSPGMAFRSGSASALLDFDDGSNILLRPGSVVRVSENGLGVERGELAVTVPEQAENSLRILLADRELAVRPGTMLAVNAHNPDKYAAGGAPAPEVMVADGGLAFAKGRNGVGPLFANQVYLVDNYVTPDLPGRPMCAVECETMERDFAPAFDFAGNSMSQLVSAPAATFTPRTPTGFRNDNGRLVADNYDSRETVRIKYLSEDYFALADARRDLSSTLALGSSLVLDGGDGVFYEIYK